MLVGSKIRLAHEDSRLNVLCGTIKEINGDIIAIEDVKMIDLGSQKLAKKVPDFIFSLANPTISGLVVVSHNTSKQ